MSLQDYRSFLLNENKSANDKFDVKDVIAAISKISNKIIEKDTRVMTTIMVYLDDRSSQSQQINSELTNMGLDLDIQRDGKDVKTNIDGKKLLIKYKPTGGQAETTYHSTISELIPCLLWEIGYTGSSDCTQIIQSIFNAYGEDLENIDKAQIFVTAADTESAKNALFAMRSDVERNAKIPTEKIAIGWKLYDWIKSHSGSSDFYKPVSHLLWAYRVKPFDIYKKSTADIVVESGGDGAYGISIKAAGTTSEKIRMGSTSVYEMIKDVQNPSITDRYINDLISTAWEQIYDPIFREQLGDEYETFIKQNSNFKTEYCAVSSKTKVKAQSVIEEWGKTHGSEIATYTEKLSDIVKTWMCDFINTRPHVWANTLFNLSGISSSFPVIVLVGSSSGVSEFSSDDKEVLKGNIQSTSEGSGFNARIATKHTISFDITENHKKWEARVWTDKGNIGSISQLSDRMINFRIEPKS